MSELWDTAKASLEEYFASKVHILEMKEWCSKLSIHFTMLEKVQQSKTKRNRRKNIIKVRVEIN